MTPDIDLRTSPLRLAAARARSGSSRRLLALAAAALCTTAAAAAAHAQSFVAPSDDGPPATTPAAPAAPHPGPSPQGTAPQPSQSPPAVDWSLSPSTSMTCSCDWGKFAKERDEHKPTPAMGATFARWFLQLAAVAAVASGVVYLSGGNPRWAKQGAVGSTVGAAFGLSWYGVEISGDDYQSRQRALAEFDFCFSQCPLAKGKP
jgi:hypothetical protein